jgi:hypothetical protein
MIFFIQIENNFFLGFCPYHEKKLEILLKCHVYIKIILILYCSLISQKETDITWASHGPYCFAHFPLNINNTNRQLAEVARPATKHHHFHTTHTTNGRRSFGFANWSGSLSGILICFS